MVDRRTAVFYSAGNQCRPSTFLSSAEKVALVVFFNVGFVAATGRARLTKQAIWGLKELKAIVLWLLQ